MWLLWYFGLAKNWLMHVAPAIPPQCWAITVCVFLILGVAAVIDACTGVVPDVLIFLGMLLVLGVEGCFGSWGVATYHLLAALLFAVLIGGVNHIWYLIAHRDALGMGDAKWTMVSVACFGAVATGFAWGIGAVLAVLFITVMRLTKSKIEQVTFAPFLFIGLCESLFWIHAHGLDALFNI